MGLDWISSTKVQNNNTFGRDNNDVKPLDVAVADGEFLDLQELMQKFIMTALGTDDPVKADEFIKQSGFDFGGKMPSRMQENGKSFYRFEPSEDFQKSIESFQKTGKAMPLGEVSNNTNGNKINANGQTQTGTPQQPTNITFEPKTPPMPPPALRREPKIYNANGGDNKFNPNDWIKVELDPKDFVTVIQKKREKPQITISGDGDPRREIYEKALYKVFGGKVDQSIIKEQLSGKTDKNSVYYVGTDDTMSSQKTIDNLSNAVITKKNYTFYFSKSLAEDFGRKQIERFGTEQQKLQLQIADKLKAIDEKYDNIDVTNNLQKFALGLAHTTEKKDAIDELVGNSKIDFRDDSNKIADGYADGFEKGVRTILETNPLFNILSDSAKQELVNYGVGLGKGTVSLAGSAVGVNNFVRDTFQDLLVSGMENIGIDTSSIKKNLSTSRQSEQQNWSAIMNARTNEMARGDYSITTKTNTVLKPNFTI